MKDSHESTTDATTDELGAWGEDIESPQLEHQYSGMNVVFRLQPKPIQARHRVTYRTALLVLVLSRFNKNAAKLTNLHTVVWATRSKRTRQMFTAWWMGRR